MDKQESFSTKHSTVFFYVNVIAPLLMDTIDIVYVSFISVMMTLIGLSVASGSKPLHAPYNCSVIWLHDLCLEVLTLHGNKLHLFMGQSIPPPLFLFMSRAWYNRSIYYLFSTYLVWSGVVQTRTRYISDCKRTRYQYC